MVSPEEWFKNLTPICKTWLTIAVVTTVGIQFKMINPMWIYLDFSLVWYKFHIWRLVTNFFFFGQFSFGWLIQMFILSRYTQLLETTEFVGSRGTADFLFLLLFCGSGLCLLNWMIGGMIPFMGTALSFVVMYVWSRKNPFNPVNIWGFTFEAWYLPFVMALLHILMGGNPTLDIFGILVGHLYHFLTDIIPRVYGNEYSYLETPQFIVKLFDNTEVRRDWRGSNGHRLN